MNPQLRSPLPRRTFLKAGAVSLALPLLNAMLPSGLRADQRAAALCPKRLLLIGRNLGLHAPFLFPETPGLNYEGTRYLDLLEEHRGSFTLFSGVSHLGYNDHKSEPGLFTGVHWDRIKDPTREHHNSISLDQFAAQHLGRHTRYSNLVIGAPVQWHFSWTGKGVPVPTERRPTEVFKQLFLDGAPEQVSSELRRLRDGRSILDRVVEESKAMTRNLGQEDKERIDLMFTSIREAERNFKKAEAWTTTPKPRVDYPLPPKDPTHDQLVARETLWFDITRLAFQTDSTRVILLTLGDAGRAQIEGLSMGHHDASHHGKDEKKIEQLALIEEEELRQFGRFLSSMKAANEGESHLLNQTAILSASNLSNASAHTCENLPIFLAGGGFRHQGHVLHDRKKNTPLSNLFVRMLQQLGIEQDRFGASTGTLSEI
ncbi:MAG: hypothetical protein RLZZ399_2565 [Verrucomicrobiota bacterium]